MERGLGLEIRILSVIKVKKSYHKYRSILQSGFFGTEETRQVFILIDEYFEKNKDSKLLRSNLRTMIHQKVRNEDLQKSCLRVVKKIRKQSDRDSSVVEEAIKDFCKRQYAKQAIMAGLEAIESESPDFTIIQEHLEKAISISVDVERDCCRYFDEPEGRLIMDTREGLISTGIPRLDEALNGGFGAGDLVVFLAPPERGKTLALINMAVAALYQGKKVGYITLELSERRTARRFDLRVTGRTFKSLKEDPSRIKDPLASLRKTGCDLVIKDYSAQNPTLDDLKAFLINYQNRMHQKFDLLLVDYADLVRPTRNYKTERFGIKEVYTNLRRLANEFKFPLVTASQANRRSMTKQIVSMEDFAEDFQKAGIADIVIAICQTPEELEDELCRLYIAKNRASGKHLYFRCSFRPMVMYMGEDKTIKRKSVADRI